MLRLWPEQITVGLFPGNCWLRWRGQSSTFMTDADAGASTLASAFDTILGQAGARSARVDIISSDKVSHIVGLPWQEQLRTETERYAYALAAFNHAGISVDADWVCTTAFRRYRELGLGIATPAAWLEQLEAIARNRGCRLRTVLPVSAAAYWAPRKQLGDGSAWMLLEEYGRLTSLCFERGELAAYEAQPVSGDMPGGERLLRRQLLTMKTPALVATWKVGAEPCTTALKAIVPEARIHSLDAYYWDAHA